MTDIDKAIEALQMKLALDPYDSAGFHQLAGLKLSNGDIDGAIAAYSSCITFAPQDAGARNNFGVALLKARRFGEAVAILESALILRPGYTRALVNLGKALRELGRPHDAIARLREALSIQPDYVPALINLGDANAAIGDSSGALQALDRAVRLAPAHVEAHMSLGIARLQADHVAESLHALHTAVALAPDHSDAHSNLAHALFCSGDWRASWPHFEYRFARPYQAKLRAPPGVPRWDGSFSDGLELWLLGEQGLGDQLMFARYAVLLRARGVSCTIACDPRLVKILELAALGARVVPLDAAPDVPQARWIPLMSLPAWHGTGCDTVPAAAGYLAADPRRIERWRPKLPAAPRLRVALSWAGNPRMETGRYAGRSPPLTALAPLMKIPGISFISLQKGSGEDQLDVVPFGASILRLPALDAGPDAFLDTAAVLKCVDLLVTSDTAIAHLAGGLGVPCWLCLMHEPDWRWMRRGSSTPWYASMRLFRQPAAGDWASVYAEVADALADCAAICKVAGGNPPRWRSRT
jgi:tetratricopeptide (TPR) repeat protein